MMKKVASKGYTVEAVSWENDGDNYQTRTQTYSTLEEAKAVRHMCENLFQEEDWPNPSKSIGNMGEDDYKQAMLVTAQYLAVNPEILKINKIYDETKLKADIEKEYKEELVGADFGWKDLVEEYIETREDLIKKWWGVVADYNSSLLGCSEYYISRVCESVEVTYLSEDVYAEVVE